MSGVKISDAAPAAPLEPTDLVPIARGGLNVPLNAIMADIAEYCTVLASTHPPAMSNLPETAGVMQQYARADHVHPTDQSRAPVDSPSFTGHPTAPTMLPTDNSDALATTKFVHDLGQSGTLRTQTPGIDDNSELVATTEFVQNQSSTQPPLMDGVPTAGVSQRFSRGDHTHPTDVTRAAASAIPLAGDETPTMNGNATTGNSTAFSREDHCHPVDVSRYSTTNPAGYQTASDVATALGPYAPILSPQFKGTPTAPNPTPSTDADQSIATTYFVRTGVTDGSDALAGQVAEYLSAQTLSTTPVALTSGTDTSIATLSLGPGDWDITASIGFTMANNNSSTLRAWINITGTSVAPPVDQVGGNVVMPIANNTPQVIMPLVPTRVSITATTTVRLGATQTSSGGTISGWGKLMARRRR